eukprot:COSAG01_NODE_1456_length_10254_cov_12.591630_3_plen_61_part_00
MSWDWLPFAGVKGATNHWFDRSAGIRKRYGKLLTVAEGGEGGPTVMYPLRVISIRTGILN